MNTFKPLLISFLLLLSITSLGQSLTKGVVTYELKTYNTDDQIALEALGKSTVTIFFDDKHTATEMNMMGGAMIMKNISSNTDLQNPRVVINLMGKKYEITDAEETNDMDGGISLFKNIKSITYNKKDTKEIMGYKCYRANVTLKDGSTGVFYITNKIALVSLQIDNGLKLEGYPLEIQMKSMIVRANKVSKDLPVDSFTIPSGYQKVTMKEFERITSAGI